MKNTKRFFPLFKFYAKEQIEKYLEDKALGGWFLEKMEGFGWKFRKGEPKKLTFSVNYFAKASSFDPAPSEDQEAYYELCSYSGWYLVTSNAQMQIFCTERNDATPIETDPVLEIQSIHRSVKRSFYPIWILWIVLGLFQTGLSLLSLFGNTVDFLSGNPELLKLILYPVVTAFYIKELVGYTVWHKKARRNAETFGSYTCAVGTNKASLTVILIFALFFMISLVFSTLNIGNTPLVIFLMISTIVEIVVLLAATLGVHKLLKKQKASKKTNLVLTIVTASVLSVVLTTITVILSDILFLTTDSIQKNLPEPPLCAGDIMTVDSENQQSSAFFDDSFFLSKYEYDETNMEVDRESLSYTVITVKADPLYDVCVNDLLDDINLFGYTGERYEKADAALFKAEDAYVLYDEDSPENEYILCYDKKIVKIRFSTKPTKEQMAAVGEAFN